MAPGDLVPPLGKAEHLLGGKPSSRSPPGGWSAILRPWEADDDWGWEGSEQTLTQLRVCRERRKGHAKGDERRRSAALGDIAEEDRVFALRLAGLDGEVGRNSGG